MTLTDFLLARIAEDEGDAPGDPSPTRWLAECKTKRRIVARHQSSAETRGVGQQRNGKWTPYCEYESADWPCPDVTDLAAVYADHPDYRDEWKP